MKISYRFSPPGDEWTLKVCEDFISRFGKSSLVVFVYVFIGWLFLLAGIYNYLEYREGYIIYLLAGLYALFRAVWKRRRRQQGRARAAYRMLERMKEYPGAGLPGMKEINEEGIKTTLDDGALETIEWKDVSDSIEGEDYFYFAGGKLLIELINKGDMSGEQIRELREWLSSHGKWGKGSPLTQI